MGIDQIMIFSEIPLSLKVFNISNLSITLTNKCRNQEDENIFINNIQEGDTEKAMVVYTDCSTQRNPGPTGSATVIQELGPNSIPAKLSKAITYSGANSVRFQEVQQKTYQRQNGEEDEEA